MSRLYYEGEPASGKRYLEEGPGSTHGGLPRLGLDLEDEPASGKRYLEKVAKIVPSEVVAGYVSLVGFIPMVRHEPARPWLFLTVFLLCLVLTPIYFWSQAEKSRPHRNHLIISTVAFVV